MGSPSHLASAKPTLPTATSGPHPSPSAYQASRSRRARARLPHAGSQSATSLGYCRRRYGPFHLCDTPTWNAESVAASQPPLNLISSDLAAVNQRSSPPSRSYQHRIHNYPAKPPVSPTQLSTIFSATSRRRQQPEQGFRQTLARTRILSQTTR